MAANDPSVGRSDPLARLRWALWISVVLLAAVAVALYLAARSSNEAASPAVAPNTGPAASWAAGERRAPGFSLTDENGKTITLAGLRGRRVIVTFLDPHCTTFCPRESLVLNDAVRRLPAEQRPAIVAVSVDPTVRSLTVLRKEARRFKWLPEWRWAVGSAPQLEAVWRSYHIQVVPAAADIGHTEAAYLVDARGDQRALFLWPFHAVDVAATLSRLP